MHERRAREKNTLKQMIAMYCHGQHGTKGELCQECRELMDYAIVRLDKCPYEEDKSTCAKCPTHCYKPVMRDRVREVMRYSGPRMAYKHPMSAIHHFVDGRKKPPKPKNSGS